jgi:acyl-coenzyme A synthetase/AMP-(fatty) acid ligase
LTPQQILQELKQHFDAAFLPRPIYQVSELPREKSGKLPRKNLLALWQRLSQQATVPLAQQSAE